jgi:ABC-type multidrug transport system fused ATPase/permease subunit
MDANRNGPGERREDITRPNAAGSTRSTGSSRSGAAANLETHGNPMEPAGVVQGRAVENALSIVESSGSSAAQSGTDERHVVAGTASAAAAADGGSAQSESAPRTGLISANNVVAGAHTGDTGSAGHLSSSALSSASSEDEPPTYVPRKYLNKSTPPATASDAVRGTFQAAMNRSLVDQDAVAITVDDIAGAQPAQGPHPSGKQLAAARQGMQAAFPKTSPSFGSAGPAGRYPGDAQASTSLPAGDSMRGFGKFKALRHVFNKKLRSSPDHGEFFMDYYAMLVYGIYPDGSLYARTLAESMKKALGSSSTATKQCAEESLPQHDANGDSADEPAMSAALPPLWNRRCGLFQCCGFSLCACSMDSDTVERNLAELKSIANLLSPRQWLLNAPLLTVGGLLAALASGVIFPAYLFLFGHVVNYWAQIFYGVIAGNPVSSIHRYLIGFGVISGAAAFVVLWQSRSLGTIGRRVRYRLRLWSFAALLLTTGVGTDRLDRWLFEQNTLDRMELLVLDAVEHLSSVALYAAQAISSFIFGIIESWFLTLVLLGTTPILAGLGMLQLFVTRRAQQRYEEAARKAREFLQLSRAALPNVVYLEQFQKEFQRLYEFTDVEREHDARLNLLQSLLRGLTFGLVLAIFAVLGIYIGGHLARTKHRSSGRLVTAILFAIMLIISLLRMTENLVRYSHARQNLYAYLDFVLDIVDASQAGLGTVLRVDDRCVRVVFDNVSVKDDPEDWASKASSTASPLEEDRGVSSTTSGRSGSAPASAQSPGTPFGSFAESYTLDPKVTRHGIGSRYAQYVFHSLNLTIEHHQIHCIILRKRREERLLLELLSGKRRPDSGRIMLGEHPMQDYTSAALTAAIGLVPWRGSRLIAGLTVFENIAFGATGTCFAEVRRAASLVGMHEVILRLANGYQTMVPSARTAQALFTSSQLQALGIARVLLRNPSMLLLDSESYAALLDMTENGVALDLKAICTGRTVVFVLRADLVESLYFADMISVIESGHVVEQGPHYVLMERAHGIYAQIARASMAREVDLGNLTLDDDDDVTGGIADDSGRNGAGTS